ncbi:MAG TPA: XTP/dITP diphosphatase [Clostridiaceae bacterium]|nr:XTP/dITP diphosphatase [Clostridiaceae bacterium]
MEKFIVASKNKGKLIEIQKLLEGLPYKVISMEEAGFSGDIEETGKTFEENAFIKARAVFNVTGGMVMADDSGLEVDYLNGLPGIYSSRYAGEGASDQDRNEKLLRELRDVPFEKRTARFVCAIALILPDGKHISINGSCEGYIGFEPVGDNGFGYDPLFFIPEYNATMAQLSLHEKNKISHRGKALRLLVDKLKNYEIIEK